MHEADFDSEFGQNINWGRPEGFNYQFLRYFLPVYEFDAVIVTGWNMWQAWLTFFMATIFKVPLIISGENPLNQELLKSGLKQNFKRIILRQMFKKTAAFLYIGEENKKFFMHYGVPEHKLFFAPYAVDNEYFFASKRFLPNNQNCTVLFVGSLTEKKRPMDLLKAYRQLNNRNNVRLIFVGEGILKSKLQNYAKLHNLNSVEFAGFQPQDEITKFYGQADIFVLPSGMDETWGLVVNEAMCFGLPIIASSLVGCSQDLVYQNENGFVFPCGNINKLTECLAQLIRNLNLRKTFGQNSLKIIQKYSFENDRTGILAALKYIKQ